jgi:UDP-GlcNAc3NAcA epimerase
MRVLSIVGARPQFVKMAVVCRAAATQGVEHHIVHTGQHYDAEMSDVFFQELDIPAPDHHLGVGSGSHGAQTGEMIKRLEPVLAQEQPDWVLLYGDTNSTLAGAVVASKMGLRVAHVEAGLRSFNRRMPEELNRIATDHLSDLLLCPTQTAIENLRREGLENRAILTGDVMYDAVLAFRQRAESQGGQLADRWRPGAFALATVHRAENTDDSTRLLPIITALDEIAATICPVVLPLHPRTEKRLGEMGWVPRTLTVIRPISYLEMILMQSRARFILTDSGGVQKEAYFAQVPCITLRDETEWLETLANNCNVLVGADKGRILAAAAKADHAGPWTAAYGDGQAGGNVLEAMRTRASA